MKTGIVEVTRYIRPKDVFTLSKYLENDNLYGITIMYKIYYSTNIVEARWSQTKGDNFSKKIGKLIAKSSPPYFFKYVQGDPLSQQLVKSFWDSLKCSEFPVRKFGSLGYGTISQLFLKASRSLNEGTL